MTKMQKFMAAYDAWVRSDELVSGPLFDAMVEARSDLEKPEPVKRLSDSTRSELVKYVAEADLSGCFGDGMEMEYIMNGCHMVGLNNISDEQLVEEYESCCVEGGTDELLEKAKGELAMDKMLSDTTVATVVPEIRLEDLSGFPAPAKKE